MESIMPGQELEGNGEVLVPQGPRCICDQFKYRPPSSSWELDQVLCDQHRAHQTKIVGVVSRSSNSHTFLAELTDEDGVLAGRAVKFCPLPLPHTLAGTFVQLRKVYHKKYILLTVDCPWQMAEKALTRDTNVGLCQLWLGQNLEDLASVTDISLTCENLESDADGVLSLGCSTELKPGRSMPFMVVEHLSRLKILDENRLCSVNKNGNVSLTCKDHPELGSQSIESLKGSEIGTITNNIDNKFMETVIRKVLLKNMEPTKKVTQSGTNMKSKRKRSSKGAAKSPPRMKFGVKSAIKVKPASVSSSNVFGADAESDDETCSNSSLASSQTSSKSVKSIDGTKKTGYIPGKLAVPTVKSAETNNTPIKTGQAIPTIMNTQPAPAVPVGSILPTRTPLPDLSKPPPMAVKPPHLGFLSHPPPRGPSPLQHLPPPVPSALLNCSQPPACTLCQISRSHDVVRCPSCPQYKVILDQDLLLPSDTSLVGEVKVEGLKDGPFVKIFSLGGTIHIPDSLNLAFSNNPDATPKRIDDTVTMNFLNTGPKDILLKKETPVTMAQLMKMSS